MAQQKAQSTRNPAGAGDNPSIDPGVGVGNGSCGCGADTDWTIYPAQQAGPGTGSTTTGRMNLTGRGKSKDKPAVGESAGLGAPGTTGLKAQKDLGATLPLDKSVEE